MSRRAPPQESVSLFDTAPGQEVLDRAAADAPLAARMRPRTLEEYVGQEDILGPGRLLRKILDEAATHKDSALPSMIFWGPPGTGKTTLAYLVSRAADAEFVMFSAVSSGIKEAREVIELARDRLRRDRRRTVLFVDEIHRFNKAQQDAFLPAIEDGIISLLGATTENPSFEINNALLSRCRVFTLKSLEPTEIETLLRRALTDRERGLGHLHVTVESEALAWLANLAGGDARSALGALEFATLATPPQASSGIRHVTLETVRESLQRNSIPYDRNGEEHYNLISALHKSIRHSDPDASLYYLAVMIEGGEDPIFIARRLVRAASEDIGSSSHPSTGS